LTLHTASRETFQKVIVVVRQGGKEYLNYLNIALGSCGEFHSCYTSCKQAEQITANDYQRLDQLHYKVENT
jgi:four helix bundle protein